MICFSYFFSGCAIHSSRSGSVGKKRHKIRSPLASQPASHVWRKVGKSEQKLRQTHLHLIYILLSPYVHVHRCSGKIGKKCIYSKSSAVVFWVEGGQFSQNHSRGVENVRFGGTWWGWEWRVIRIMGADKKVKSGNYIYVHNFYTHFNRFLKNLRWQSTVTEKMAARFTFVINWMPFSRSWSTASVGFRSWISLTAV